MHLGRGTRRVEKRSPVVIRNAYDCALLRSGSSNVRCDIHSSSISARASHKVSRIASLTIGLGTSRAGNLIGRHIKVTRGIYPKALQIDKNTVLT